MFYNSNECARTTVCCETISKEVKGLTDRGVLKTVKRKAFPANANVLTTHIGLAVKDIGTPNEKYKALVATQGYNDSDQESRVHNALSARPISLRILLIYGAITRYRIWETDIVQAFIHSFDLDREIYIIPPSAFGLGTDDVFLLVKPFWRLCDASAYCYVTLRVFLRDEICTINFDSDVSFYFKSLDDELNEMMSTYIDDICSAGDELSKKSQISPKVASKVSLVNMTTFIIRVSTSNESTIVSSLLIG